MAGAAARQVSLSRKLAQLLPSSRISRRPLSTATKSAQKPTHIIVGGGSAGCVLANRLTEDENNNVLLLEAGPSDVGAWDSWKIHMPAALTYNLCDDKYNWYYETVPQKHMNDRRMYWPRGRVLGGSSSLNAMVYIRGHAFDYDRWGEEGADGWSYASCLPYFRKAQGHELGEDDYRGGSGPFKVSRGKTKNPLFAAFIEAGQQAGYPFTDDMNGYQQEGLGWMDMTIHKGKRWSTASAYLRPAMDRPNLTVKTNTMTEKIVFDGKRAVGVQVRPRGGGDEEEIRCDSEVILCGGAINSPQLLMVSGVGPQDHLKEHDIPVVHHSPGVGNNLQDHLEVYVQQECTQNITLYSAQRPWNMVVLGIEWFLQQKGLCASAHLEAGGFIRSKEGVRHPDLQFHFLPSVVNDHGRKPGECHAYQVHVGSMRAQATGTLKLKSNNPYEHPVMNPNYLAHPEDVREMRDAVRLSQEIFSQRAFDDFRGKTIQPLEHVQTDDEVDAFVREKGDSAYHPSCTAKMGSASDEMAVVNEHGQVYGIEALRVVDASIMPSIVSGNLNAPTVMMAEKIADAIKGNAPLPLSSAAVYDAPDWQTKQR